MKPRHIHARDLPPHIRRAVDAAITQLPAGCRIVSVTEDTPVTVRGKPKRKKPVDTRGRKK
jgi:hypothetical protein